MDRTLAYKISAVVFLVPIIFAIGIYYINNTSTPILRIQNSDGTVQYWDFYPWLEQKILHAKGVGPHAVVYTVKEDGSSTIWLSTQIYDCEYHEFQKLAHLAGGDRSGGRSSVLPNSENAFYLNSHMENLRREFENQHLWDRVPYCK